MISHGVKIALSAVAIAVIIAAAVTAVAVTADIFITLEKKDTSYSITYELNGGINSTDNPDSYTAEQTVDFKTPTREGYIFDGWFTENDYKNRIWSTENRTGDLKIYAKWHEKQVYTITYELNGGTNSPNNPDTYLEDSAVMLSQPTKYNSVFYGWHYKSDFSDDRIDYIARHTDSNVTLYAEWSADRTGYTLKYDNSGTYKTPVDWNDMDITGTTNYTYLTYEYEKGYHMKCVENNSINIGTTSSWTLDHDLSKWVLTGHETIIFEGKLKECDIYEATLKNGEKWTEYICADDGIPYRMEMYRVTSESDVGDITVDMTYTYTGREETPKSDTYSVLIYNDEGINSEGSGDYRALSELTLKATADEGYTFEGWYTSDGVLASSSDELYIEMLSENIVLFARNNMDHYKEEFDYPNNVELSPYISTLKSVTWTYYDEGEIKTVGDTEFKEPLSKAGEYVITYTGSLEDGSIYNGFYRILYRGDIEKRFSWTYDGNSYEMILSINYYQYAEYHYKETERYRTSSYTFGKLTFNDEHTKEFVVVDDSINKIRDWFKEKQSQKGLSNLQTANFVLCFVQSIKYVSDLESKGVLQYWKYPVETLYEQCGDDDDTSFLYCAIMKALNYSTALLMFDNHIASSINANDLPGNEITSGPFIYTEGKVTSYYYFCETTSGSWKVGDTPIGYSQSEDHYNCYIKGAIVGAVIPI